MLGRVLERLIRVQPQNVGRVMRAPGQFAFAEVQKTREFPDQAHGVIAQRRLQAQQHHRIEHEMPRKTGFADQARRFQQRLRRQLARLLEQRPTNIPQLQGIQQQPQQPGLGLGHGRLRGQHRRQKQRVVPPQVFRLRGRSVFRQGPQAQLFFISRSGQGIQQIHGSCLASRKVSRCVRSGLQRLQGAVGGQVAPAQQEVVMQGVAG